MFNLFKSKPTVNVGEKWVYMPSFPDPESGIVVEITEVHEDVVRLINIETVNGRGFKPLLEKNKLIESFKKLDQ